MTALKVTLAGLAAAGLWYVFLAAVAWWFNHREGVAGAARETFRARVAKYVRGAPR